MLVFLLEKGCVVKGRKKKKPPLVYMGICGSADHCSIKFIYSFPRVFIFTTYSTFCNRCKPGWGFTAFCGYSCQHIDLEKVFSVYEESLKQNLFAADIRCSLSFLSFSLPIHHLNLSVDLASLFFHD